MRLRLVTRAMLIGGANGTNGTNGANVTNVTIDGVDEDCEEWRANVRCASGKGAVKGSSESKEVIRFIAPQRMKAPKKIAKNQENVNNY